jgi:hypothetical protein
MRGMTLIFQEKSDMGYPLPIMKSKTTEASREFWDFITLIAERVRKGVMYEPRSFFLEPAEAPHGQQTKVLLKTATGIVLVGIILEDGTPGIYDFCTDRYIQRDDWGGIVGWMPLPE